MNRYLVFILCFVVSCVQSFIEEIQKPINIQASISYNIRTDGIFLHWDSRWEFVYFEIFRGDTPSNLFLYECVTQDAWLDKDVKPGREYWYKIKAYNSKDRLIGESAAVKGYRSYQNIDGTVVPRDFEATQCKFADRVNLYWSGRKMDCFRIYRSDTIASSYKMLVETENIEYEDTDVIRASQYHYKICVVGQNNRGEVLEKFYANSVKGSTLDAPSGLKATTDLSGEIKLTWNPDIEAKSFTVYRSDKIDGAYHPIREFVLKEEFTDCNLPNTKGSVIQGKYQYPKYYYKVQMIKSNAASGLSAVAEGTAIDPGDSLPAAILKMDIDQSTDPYCTIFSWDPITRAASYCISLYDPETCEMKILDPQCQQTIYTLREHTLNKTLHFIVQANLNKDGTMILGKQSTYIYCNMIPERPKITYVSRGAYEYSEIVEGVNIPAKFLSRMTSKEYQTGKISQITTSKLDNSGYIDLSWNMPCNLNLYKYNIYRSTTANGPYQKIAENLSDTRYRDTSLDATQLKGNGEKSTFSYPQYFYKISALYEDNEGAQSQVFSGSALNPSDILAAPQFFTIPFHWAHGAGFNKFIKFPPDATCGSDKISGSILGNKMILTWSDLGRGTKYKIRSRIDAGQWCEYALTSETKMILHNSNSQASSETGLYARDPYVARTVCFEITPINTHANGLEGMKKTIIFVESDTSPY